MLVYRGLAAYVDMGFFFVCHLNFPSPFFSGLLGSFRKKSLGLYSGIVVVVLYVWL